MILLIAALCGGQPRLVTTLRPAGKRAVPPPCTAGQSYAFQRHLQEHTFRDVSAENSIMRTRHFAGRSHGRPAAPHLVPLRNIPCPVKNTMQPYCRHSGKAEANFPRSHSPADKSRTGLVPQFATMRGRSRRADRLRHTLPCAALALTMGR